jgi:hypothetical protein
MEPAVSIRFGGLFQKADSVGFSFAEILTTPLIVITKTYPSPRKIRHDNQRFPNVVKLTQIALIRAKLTPEHSSEHHKEMIDAYDSNQMIRAQ